jgi:hypothetical protein
MFMIIKEKNQTWRSAILPDRDSELIFGFVFTNAMLLSRNGKGWDGIGDTEKESEV